MIVRGRPVRHKNGIRPGRAARAQQAHSLAPLAPLRAAARRCAPLRAAPRIEDSNLQPPASSGRSRRWNVSVPATRRSFADINAPRSRYRGLAPAPRFGPHGSCTFPWARSALPGGAAGGAPTGPVEPPAGTPGGPPEATPHETQPRNTRRTKFGRLRRNLKSPINQFTECATRNFLQRGNQK